VSGFCWEQQATWPRSTSTQRKRHRFFLTLGQWAHDLTLPVLVGDPTDAGGRFGGTAAGFVQKSGLEPVLQCWPTVGRRCSNGWFGSSPCPRFLLRAAMYLLGPFSANHRSAENRYPR